MRQLIVIFFFFASCKSSQKIIKTSSILITLTKMQCGSYEVKDHEVIIGYVVNPCSDNAIDREVRRITKVENLIKIEYPNYYSRFYRVYAYRINKVKDTILMATMLSPEQVLTISGWQCEEKDVETYDEIYYKKNKRLFSKKKYAPIVDYNCSKDRLASPWELE